MRLPRQLHPGAWWLWALGLATAASRTTQSSCCWTRDRGHGVRRRSHAYGRPLGADVPILPPARRRLICGPHGVRGVFGTDAGSTVLFTLPSLPLPELDGRRHHRRPGLGRGLGAAFSEGLRVAAVIACIGAASSLASPTRMLASIPAALYEVGLSVVVALTLAPQAVADVQRVRAARRLRGRPTRRDRGPALDRPARTRGRARAIGPAGRLDGRARLRPSGRT